MQKATPGERDARRPAVPAAGRTLPAPGPYAGADLTRRRVIDHGTVCSTGCPES